VYMMVISSVIAVAGVALAAWLHWLNRGVADRLAYANRQLVGLLYNKYYVDEACDAFIVSPLRKIGQLLYVIDQLVIHGLALAVGFVPRLLGLQMQTYQNGVFQGYGLGMVAGMAILLIIVLKFGL
jgi:NADH-quinone oxidoreductase subunit L